MKMLILILLMGSFIALTGCAEKKESNTSLKQKETKKPAQTLGHGESDHAHQPSQRGGTLIPIGSDRYHAEAVFEKGGSLRFYLLGQDETKVQETKAEILKGFFRTEDEREWTAITFQPEPQSGDRPGQTSVFVGQLPKDVMNKTIIVSLRSLAVGGERFRVGFKSPHIERSEHTSMPAKVADDDEKKLYLTPSGLYTLADIKANGNQTGSQKFKGLKPNHDAKPSKGDLLCPISLTKANPQFSWVIGGKTYQFCCPPCVDEFLSLAKEKPDEIKDPSFYIQK